MNSIVYFDAKSDPTKSNIVVDNKVCDREGENRDSSDRGKRYCCAICAYPVVEVSSRIEFNGSSVHTKTNPEGTEFSFTCFNSAPGCELFGLPTYEYSWFQGYQWQYAHCVNCGAQLGWHFMGDRKIFGLIQENLVECNK